MSPQKFTKRKLKEEKKETLEIIREQKTLETRRKKKKKSELDLKKEKKGKLEAVEEELSVEKEIADKMNSEEKKRKRKEKTSKLGSKKKDVKMMRLNGIGHEDEHQEDKGGRKEKIKRLGSKRKKRRESGNDVDDSNEDQIHADEHVEKEEIHLERIDQEVSKREHKETKREKKSKLSLKKKRKMEKSNEADANDEEYIHADDSAADYRLEKDRAKRSAHSQALIEEKVKNKVKHKQKDSDVAKRSKSEETLGVVEENVEEIQSVDEDCSRGMKKWLIQYKESRPGLKILQERIDDFITAYEERQEHERKEREAQAAEGGWTVVVHQKGRKKTTETETGVTVGSVAQAAVVDKMEKKKTKEVPLDFYRFQRREAQRNEVMMLRSKFEQDKKRIQQLRAARKFRPY